MIISRTILPAALICMFAGHAGADALTEAAQDLCTSVKTCVLEQLAGEGMTAHMPPEMEPMMDQMCTRMRSQVEEVPTDHELYKPALGCMRSMVSLSCEEMMSPQGASTPECTEYERLSREAGASP